MRIANPIYDSVFKYLLSDPEVARLMISTITELDIVSVEPHKTTCRWGIATNTPSFTGGACGTMSAVGCPGGHT